MNAAAQQAVKDAWTVLARKFVPQPEMASALVKDYQVDSEGRIRNYQLDVEEPQGTTQHQVKAPAIASWGRGTRVTVYRRGGPGTGEWVLDGTVSGYGEQTPVLYGGVTAVEPTLIEGLGFHIPRGDGCIIVGGVLIRDPNPRVEGTRVRICANGIKGLSDEGDGDRLAFMFATEDHQFIDRGTAYLIHAGDAQLGYRDEGHILVDSPGGVFSWSVGDEVLISSRMLNGLPYTQVDGLMRFSRTALGEGIELGRDRRGAHILQLLNQYNVPLIVARAGYPDDPNRAYLRIGPPPPFPTIEVTSTPDGTPVIRIDGRALMADSVGAVALNITYVSDVSGNLGVVRAGRAEFIAPDTTFNLWDDTGDATGLVMGYNEATQAGALMGLNAGVVQTSINANGTLTAINADISGTLTATLGVIGGWTIAAGELSSGNLKLQSTAERILLGSATAPLTGTGLFLGKDGSDYEFRVGNPAAGYIHYDGTNVYVHGSVVNDLAPGSDQSLMAWTITCVFSATDADTVEWSTGTLTFSNGVTYAISAGNSGNLTNLKYVYWDAADSGNLQYTSTYANAVGPGKVPIATVINSTTGTEAGFIVLNGSGINVRGPDIVAGSIVGANIAAGTITATLLNVSTLSAITANMGTLTSGEIRVGVGTLGSNFTGLRLWDTGSGAYALTGYDSNVIQSYVGADGRIYSGDGKLYLEREKLRIPAGIGDGVIEFYDDAHSPYNSFAWASGLRTSNISQLFVQVHGDASYDEAGFVIELQNNGTDRSAQHVFNVNAANESTVGLDGVTTVGEFRGLTNTVLDILILGHGSTSLSLAAGFGTGLKFTGDVNSASFYRDMARIAAIWLDPADATRTSYLDFQLTSGAAALATTMRLHPGRLMLNETAAIFSNQGALMVKALAADSGNAVRIVNSNFVTSTTGTSLTIGHGATTGDTYAFLQATKTGATVVTDLIFQGSGGNVGIGTTAPLTAASATLTGKAFHVTNTTSRLDQVLTGNPANLNFINPSGAADDKWLQFNLRSDGIFYVRSLKDDNTATIVESIQTIDLSTGNVGFAKNVTINGFYVLAPGSSLTIASGVITVSSSYHKVDTEGAAATDDLVTINGGVDGAILYLQANSSTRDVVVKHGTGNIRCGADFTLNHGFDGVMFRYNGADWVCFGKFDNA